MAVTHPALKIVGREYRSGKGKSIRDAVAIACGDVIGYADADNKVPIDEFDKIRPLLANGADVVVGSRAVSGARVEKPQPWYRRIGSRGFEIFMQTVVGLPEFRDTQCWLQIFPAAAAVKLFTQQQIDGYMFDIRNSWVGP